MKKSSQTGRRISRRRFLAGAAAAGAGAMFPRTPLVGATEANPEVVAQRSLTSYVDPFVGVDNDGQTVPGAGLPFGFARVSPDTTDHGEKYSTTGYDSEGDIFGFSQTHVSGTGGRSKYGNFRMTPFVGVLRTSDLTSTKSEETASPGYYAVTLDRDEIGVELTATRLCGLKRYMFPSTSEARCLTRPL